VLNHDPGECVDSILGDVFYAAPPVLTYVARKMVIHRAPSGELVARPGILRQDRGDFQMPGATVRMVWELASLLLEALAPPGWKLEDPTVALERLHYDESLEELGHRVKLTETSLGAWARLGCAIDRNWAEVAPPLRRPYLRTAVAFGQELPRIGPWIEKLNRSLRERDELNRLPSGMAFAGEAHNDARLFSCLTSHREVIRTEFLSEDGWRELPLTSDSLTIFPGTLATAHLGLEPTFHRVLNTGAHRPGSTNSTLLLGF
jgi:hypothetical protein